MSSNKYIILNIFSKRLEFLIKSRLKISQKAFADKIGVAENYLSMVLNEKSGPSADMISGIYLHYNECLEWLLTGSETRIAAPGTAEAMPEFVHEGVHPCKFCGEMTEDIKALCERVKKIIESRHRSAVPALLSNITAFEDSVKQDEDLRNLKEKVRHLEKLSQSDPVTGTGRAAGAGIKKKKM
jgi:hypothetical protein